MLTQEIERIHRSRIVELSFGKEDVLPHEGDQAIRSYDLDRAMKLGNTHKQSVGLQFKTYEGNAYETQATVWAVTEKNVELKGGKIIPIRAIFHVEL